MESFMSKRLSSHAVERSRTSSYTPKKKVGEREREREHCACQIISIRNNTKNRFLEIYEQLVTVFVLTNDTEGNFKKNRIFGLLYNSVYTAREDDPEYELINYLKTL